MRCLHYYELASLTCGKLKWRTCIAFLPSQTASPESETVSGNVLLHACKVLLPACLAKFPTQNLSLPPWSAASTWLDFRCFSATRIQHCPIQNRSKLLLKVAENMALAHPRDASALRHIVVASALALCNCVSSIRVWNICPHLSLQKSELSSNDRFVSTYPNCDICDKYQVCLLLGLCAVQELPRLPMTLTLGWVKIDKVECCHGRHIKSNMYGFSESEDLLSTYDDNPCFKTVSSLLEL